MGRPSGRSGGDGARVDTTPGQSDFPFVVRVFASLRGGAGVAEGVLIVCDCKGLTDGQVRDLIRDGWDSLPLLQAAAGIGGECGGCIVELLRLLDEELRPAALASGDRARQR